MPVDFLDDVIRLDQRALAIVVHRVATLQFGEVRVPRATSRA